MLHPPAYDKTKLTCTSKALFVIDKGTKNVKLAAPSATNLKASYSGTTGYPATGSYGYVSYTENFKCTTASCKTAGHKIPDANSGKGAAWSVTLKDIVRHEAPMNTAKARTDQTKSATTLAAISVTTAAGLVAAAIA